MSILLGEAGLGPALGVISASHGENRSSPWLVKYSQDALQDLFGISGALQVEGPLKGFTQVLSRHLQDKTDMSFFPLPD